MFANKNYQQDVKYAIQFTKNIHRILGTWPYLEELSIFMKGFMLLHKAICFFLLSSVLIPALLYAWLVENRTVARIKLIAPILYCFMALGKYFTLVLRNSHIKNCMKHLQADWKHVRSTVDRKIMLEKIQIGRRLMLSCTIFMYLSGSCFRVVLPLSKGKIIINENLTIRPLAFPSYFVYFNPQVTPIYEIVFTLHCMSGFITYSITIGICGLATTFVMHACGQLSILIVLMKALVEKQDISESLIDSKIALIVEHQIRTKRFLDLVENTLKELFLIEVFGCTLIVCLLGYHIIMEWRDNNAVGLTIFSLLMISIITNIFTVCFIGEQLSKQVEKVAITSCILEWYRLPQRKAMSIILIIAMSHYPTKITAGKIAELSFRTFGAVLRTSAAYCNILRNAVD